ncbi:MAG: sigma-54 dependent transcriptional regulator [bacterium]|nr:sigma-54 dependent transcriptional regulator [bacterium]
MKSQILIVDDEESVRYSFMRFLQDQPFDVVEAASGEEALSRCDGRIFDLIFLDVKLPDRSGLDVLRDIREKDPKATVIVMTAFGTTDTAIQATKYGAYDYVLKPFDMPAMESLIRSGLKNNYFMRRKVTFRAQESAAEAGADRIIGRSAPMQNVYKIIGKVADSNVSVLLRGESGTGKELIARAVYQHSGRMDKPFLAVNCAAIPETLLESELFGYEKGAFTGAVRRRIGKFEQADRGTLFLDEIGDMSLSTQAKILRVLQEGRFEPLGSEKTVQVDVRLIAATNRNLEKGIREGRFREDLYYRIKVVSIHLPPLRERIQDLEELTAYFLDKYGNAYRNEAMKPAPGLLEEMRKYSWPGNIRELENVLKRAVLLSKTSVIPKELVLEEMEHRADRPDEENRGVDGADETAEGGSRPDGITLYEAVMSRTEKSLISRVLKETRGNQVRAAKILGISRMTLRKKIRKYGMED